MKNKLAELIKKNDGLFNGEYIFNFMIEVLPEELQDIYMENMVVKEITDESITLIVGDDSEIGIEIKLNITDEYDLEVESHHKLDNKGG